MILVFTVSLFLCSRSEVSEPAAFCLSAALCITQPWFLHPARGGGGCVNIQSHLPNLRNAHAYAESPHMYCRNTNTGYADDGLWLLILPTQAYVFIYSIKDVLLHMGWHLSRFKRWVQLGGSSSRADVRRLLLLLSLGNNFQFWRKPERRQRLLLIGLVNPQQLKGCNRANCWLAGSIQSMPCLGNNMHTWGAVGQATQF